MKKLLCGTIAALMISLPLYAQTSSSTPTAPSDSGMYSGSSVDSATIQTKKQKMEETSITRPAPATGSETGLGTGSDTSEDAQMQQDNSTINSGSTDMEMQKESGVEKGSSSITTPSDDIEEEE